MKMIVELQLELPIEHGMRSGYVEPYLTCPWRCERHGIAYEIYEFIAEKPLGGTLRLQAVNRKEARAIAAILQRKTGRAIIDWDDDEDEGGIHASVSAG